MNSEKTKYKCARCDSTFEGIWYTFYELEKGKYLDCPECGAKLVTDFDFKLAAKLSDLYLILSFIVAVLVAITSFYWSYEDVGQIILYIGIAIGLPIIFLDDYIVRFPELYPRIKKTRELVPEKDS